LTADRGPKSAFLDAVTLIFRFADVYGAPSFFQLEWKSCFGSGTVAPRKNVRFTTCLYHSPVHHPAVVSRREPRGLRVSPTSTPLRYLDRRRDELTQMRERLAAPIRSNFTSAVRDLLEPILPREVFARRPPSLFWLTDMSPEDTRV